MTIDERLEKLAQRTDAIAQNLELLASLRLDSERRNAERDERYAKSEESMVQLIDTMNRLDHPH